MVLSHYSIFMEKQSCLNYEEQSVNCNSNHHLFWESHEPMNTLFQFKVGGTHSYHHSSKGYSDFEYCGMVPGCLWNVFISIFNCTNILYNFFILRLYPKVHIFNYEIQCNPTAIITKLFILPNMFSGVVCMPCTEWYATGDICKSQLKKPWMYQMRMTKCHEV